MNSSPLLLDYYQLSMLEVYLEKGLTGPASFEFFIRKVPDKRNFLVAAGLEQALHYLSTIRFSKGELDYLKGLGFSQRLLDYLADFSFTGDLWAMPEGTIFFENEPILQVNAPLPQAQLLETRLINILHFQTLIASKAVRVKQAAGTRPIIDFGFRRSHEADAGLMAARACYIAGFAATATVEAGAAFGIPVTGTMAHSYILAHESEEQAFRNFIEVFGERSILLIDTFNTLEGARLAARLFHEYVQQGTRIKGVRIDSGNLLELTKKVRAIFETEGCKELSIFVSGGLDEYQIKGLLSKGAPVDGFGVGTAVNTSEDAPYLDCAYKMVEYNGSARMKLSQGKATLPFRKQVLRKFNSSGLFEEDVIARCDELVAGRPLLEKFIEKGQIVKREGLEIIRKRLENELEGMPADIKDLGVSAHCRPSLSSVLSLYLKENRKKPWPSGNVN